MKRRIALVSAGMLAVSLMGMICHGGESSPPWWRQKTYRMLQTNLPEIDADMDVEKYVADVKDFGANVVLFNVGGIVANYPTDLEFHYRNPYCKGDVVGEVLERLHANGIRMIARFDFSKVNETIAARYPDWLYISEKGQTVADNGQVHACLNGGYQQDAAFQILREAVGRYPFDGVFFNMTGYTRSDYRGVTHGICQCDNCKRRFATWSGGQRLPSRADAKDPVYQDYQRFCRETAMEHYQKIRQVINEVRPGTPVCMTGVPLDIVRLESNARLDPDLYSDTKKQQWMQITFEGRPITNTAVHFPHYPHRHAGVSPHLTHRRIYQHMVNGGWVDFYCIGRLDRLEDRLGLDAVRDLFHFHAANEKWLGVTTSAAEVGLVRRDGPEFDGLYQILAEDHLPLDLVSLARSPLDRYRVLVVPDAERLSREECAQLDAFVENGGRLLLTGKIPSALACAAALKFKQTIPRQQGTYLRIRPKDKEHLAVVGLRDVDLVFLDGPFHEYKAAGAEDALLRYIPPAMFGPPEKCYYTEVSDIPGLFQLRYKKGMIAVFPWEIGTHYNQMFHAGHAMLVSGAIRHVLGFEPRVNVRCPPMVEVTHRKDPRGRFEWVSLYHHAPRMAGALHAPVPIANIEVVFAAPNSITSVRLLKAGRALRAEKIADGHFRCVVPVLDRYEIVLVEF